MALSKARSGLLQRLQHRNQRERERCFIVEGVRAVAAALEERADIRFAVVSPRLTTLDRESRLEKRLIHAGVDVVAVDDKELGALTDTIAPQGVLLVCKEPATTLDSLLTEGTESESTTATRPTGRGILVADAVQDPANLASMIRTGAAFGLAGLIALDGTVDPWNAKVVRGSAGGCFRLHIARASVAETLDGLHRHNVTLLAADAGGINVADVETPARWALAIGNEGAGLRSAVSDAASRAVSVPIRPEVESLSAGTAAAILCYELAGKANPRCRASARAVTRSRSQHDPDGATT